jgi:hypothetical protein
MPTQALTVRAFPLVLVAFTALAACSDATEEPGGSAGGSSGSGGTAGSAGSNGGAGSSGTAGSAGSGTAGSAGSGTAGSAGSSGGAGAQCAARTGGAVIEFEIVDDTFSIWVENADFIAEARRLLSAGETRVPVFGTLIDGTDCDEQWSWHADPNDVEFADFTIELCDGVPSYIEENKQEWFDSVGAWCPWSAVVTAVDER